MSGMDGVRTIRYAATTPDEVQRDFEADRERVRAFGFVPIGSWWDQSASQPTLVVDYRYEPGGRGAMTSGRPGGDPGPRSEQARSSGLGPAILIVGAILAGLVLLAVAIPPSPPPATPAPLPSPAASVVPTSAPVAAQESPAALASVGPTPGASPDASPGP